MQNRHKLIDEFIDDLGRHKLLTNFPKKNKILLFYIVEKSEALVSFLSNLLCLQVHTTTTPPHYSLLHLLHLFFAILLLQTMDFSKPPLQQTTKQCDIDLATVSIIIPVCIFSLTTMTFMAIPPPEIYNSIAQIGLLS
jgi:hypothetical protein